MPEPTVDERQTLRNDLTHPEADRRRKAIIRLTRQGDLDALPALTRLASADPDPDLRTLAGKAVLRLRQTDSASDLFDPLGVDQADAYFAAALRHYRDRRLEAVRQPLAAALRRDPALHTDRAALLMAQAVTGLPPQAAVAALIDADRYDQTRVGRRPGRWGMARRKRGVARFAFFVVLIAVGLLLFLRSGSFEYYRDALQSSQWRDALHNDAAVDYYVLTPTTPTPATGWPVLVALPSFGAPAEALLPYFAEQAGSDGVLLVVPNFGQYPFPYETETLPALNEIILRVRQRYPADRRGVVLFGFVTGGEIALLYAREYYGVLAVSAASALELHAPPDDPTIRYLLTYTQADTLIGYNRELAARFAERGHDVDFVVLSGTEDVLDERQVALTMGLVREVYDD